jgi:hypothetical protein
MFVPLVAGIRDLIILLDEASEQVAKDFATNDCLKYTGKSNMAVTTNLMTALYQKAAPILVSVSVWRNFIERRQMFNDFTLLSIDDLFVKYKYLPCFASKNTVEQLKKACQYFVDDTITAEPDASLYNLARDFFLSHHVAFNPVEWKLYMIGPSFCLLVPIAYSKSLEKIDDSPFATLSNEQLGLGLKPLVPMENPLDPSAYPKETVDMSEKFISILPELFITKNDVKSLADKNKNEEYEYKYLHRWHIFLNGHGSQAAQSSLQIAFIAGLKEDYFKRFLHFLNNMVITEFFMYQTCYAGGQHLLTPYERQWMFPSIQTGQIRLASRADRFNFTIVTGTLFQDVLITSGPTIITQHWSDQKTIKKKITVHFPIKFDEFFKQLKKFFTNSNLSKSSVSLESIINFLHRFIDPNTKKMEFGYQLPVVRFPGTEWFSLVNVSDLVKRLSTTLVAVHEAENTPIIIEKERMVLIDTGSLVKRRLSADEHSEMLVPLVIKKTVGGIPVFMSTAVKNSIQYFDAIETGYGLLALLNAFMPFKDSFYSRWFYVHRIVCENDVKIPAGLFKVERNGTIVLEQVIILNNATHPFNAKDTKRYNGMIFKNSGISYEAIWESTDQQKNDFLSKKVLPNMLKISDYPFRYPFEDEIVAGPKLKRLFQTLKEHSKKEPPVPVETRPEEFKNWQKKDTLIDRLNELKAALSRLAGLIGSA